MGWRSNTTSSPQGLNGLLRDDQMLRLAYISGTPTPTTKRSTMRLPSSTANVKQPSSVSSCIQMSSLYHLAITH